MPHGVLYSAVARNLGLPRHLNPKLLRFRLRGRLIVGSEVLADTDTKYTEEASVSITQDAGVVYEGRMATKGVLSVVPLDTSRMNVRITLQPYPESCDCIAPAVYEWRTKAPKAKRPWLFVWVTRFPQVGKPTVIWWWSTAKRMKIQSDDGYKVDERIEGPCGQIILFREVSGKIILRFLATTEHAFTLKTVVRTVRPQKLRLHVEQAEQSARPGELVTYEWAVTPPEAKVWLEAPARRERHVLEAVGKFVIEMGKRPEEIVLFAQCGSVTKSRTLLAIPYHGIESAQA
jgi:hypothetical protein